MVRVKTLQFRRLQDSLGKDLIPNNHANVSLSNTYATPHRHYKEGVQHHIGITKKGRNSTALQRQKNIIQQAAGSLAGTGTGALDKHW